MRKGKTALAVVLLDTIDDHFRLSVFHTHLLLQYLQYQIPQVLCHLRNELPLCNCQRFTSPLRLTNNVSLDSRKYASALDFHGCKKYIIAQKP